MVDFEKLGAFYLGRPYDVTTRTGADVPLLYDSRDLVTHAACIGMTGSGKTGLCMGLIEEALIDGIPALIIDPKGDAANLMLTFPDLTPEQFQPWVNEDDARRAGRSVAEFAASEATLWRDGLARWGQDAARVRALRAAADVVIYTPGSTSGRPVNVLASFKAPSAEVIEDSELLRDRLTATVSGLLGLVGMTGEPLQSREHILLANLLEASWKEGRGLDLIGLIQAIQSPPMTRVGALDLEAFYPAKDRFALAMTLNNLLAAPGFDVWMQGESLDVGRLLRSSDGRPQAAILSIAHLNDAERMFFVSLLLTEVIGWMRAQAGTSSLRALLYMDEVAGYLPPVAAPPSKAPLLLLLKQARAFGLGVVLATQNPVDLDYKGLGNIGTWFIGRLQTERDKARLLDGLQGTSLAAGMDRTALDATLSALGRRVFLMHNVHENVPVTFETRWTLSYLRGPLTRAQIRQLMEPASPSEPSGGGVAAPTPSTAPLPVAARDDAPGAAHGGVSAPASTLATVPPILPPGIRQHFLPRRSPTPRGATLEYVPVLYASATVRVADARRGIEETMTLQRVSRLHDGPVPVSWEESVPTDVGAGALDRTPDQPADFAPLPAAATRPQAYDEWKRALAQYLVSTQTVELQKHADTGVMQRPGETDGAFRVRVQERQHEARDEAVDALRAKFASRLATQQDRVRRAAQAIEREEADVAQTGIQAVVTTLTGLAGALLGRKMASATNVGRLGTAARSAGRTIKARQDVARAKANHEAEQTRLADRETELEQAARAIQDRYREIGELQTVTIRPRRGDVSIEMLTLAWLPTVANADGTRTSLIA